MKAAVNSRCTRLLDGSRSRTGSVVAVLALMGVLALPGSGYAAPRLVVKVEVVGGGTANGLLVCAQSSKRIREGSIAPDGKRCVVVRKRKAKLKPPAGRYFIRVYGGLGGGPCYSRNGDGFTLSSCNRVRVKVGSTKRLKWMMPTFG